VCVVFRCAAALGALGRLLEMLYHDVMSCYTVIQFAFCFSVAWVRQDRFGVYFNRMCTYDRSASYTTASVAILYTCVYALLSLGLSISWLDTVVG
jgi:hypothetical protein